MTLARRHHRPQRHARGDPLGDEQDVRHDARVLGREHLARAAHAALHLVEDQHDAVHDRRARAAGAGSPAAARCSRPRRGRARRRWPRRLRAASPSENSSSTLSGCRTSAWYTFGAAGRSPRYFDLLAVSDSDPIVRPWNPPRKAMMPGRCVWWRASLSAASTASVPELVRNVCQWWALGPIRGRAPRAARRSRRSPGSGSRCRRCGSAPRPARRWRRPPPGDSVRSRRWPRPPRRRGRRCRRRPRPCNPRRVSPSAGSSG